MLLHMVQRIAYPLSVKNYLVPNANSAVVKKPWPAFSPFNLLTPYSHEAGNIIVAQAGFKVTKPFPFSSRATPREYFSEAIGLISDR